MLIEKQSTDQGITELAVGGQFQSRQKEQEELEPEKKGLQGTSQYTDKSIDIQVRSRRKLACLEEDRWER